MNFLLSLLKRLFRLATPVQDTAEEGLWEHLDGAEFFAVYPKVQPKANIE